MIFVSLKEYLVLFLDAKLKTKIRCGFTVSCLFFDIVFGILYITDVTGFNYNSYFRILFLIMATSFLRNTAKKMFWTFVDSYQILILYILVVGIFSCLVYIASAGPSRYSYYNTMKNSPYFYFNLTSFPKTFFSMFILERKSSYPDINVIS